MNLLIHEHWEYNHLRAVSYFVQTHRKFGLYPILSAGSKHFKDFARDEFAHVRKIAMLCQK